MGVYNNERLYGALFKPNVNDKIEFHSDIQTEKGPSTGEVISINCCAQTATIRHSDHPGETFRWADVEVSYFVIAYDGRPLWVLV
jgi:hypothetical protein